MSHKNQNIKSLNMYFSKKSENPHEIFLKEHEIRQTDPLKPKGRTLFIANIPPYVTENSLKMAFCEAGKIKNVFFQKNEQTSVIGYQFAFMVFETRENMLKALKLEKLKYLSTLETGLTKWIHEYNAAILNPVELQNEITEFMKKHDQIEEKKKSNEDELDDEGWTLVTRKTTNPGISRKESVTKKIIERSKTKSKKKELKNFYTFQIKEDKMKKLIELRKNYEESKEKVMALKKSRVFKPF